MNNIVKTTLCAVALSGGLVALNASTAFAADQETSGVKSILSGTQAAVPVQLDVELSKNAVSILGDANSQASGDTPAPDPSGNQSTDGSSSVVGGTQVAAPVDIPVEVTGNAVSLLGDATSNTPEVSTPTPPNENTLVEQSNGGSNGVVSGTQVAAPITIPVDISGNSIALLGSAQTETVDGQATSSGEVVPSQETSGLAGVLSGTQAALPVQVPITVSGNAISVLGSSTTEVVVPSTQNVEVQGPAGSNVTDGSQGVVSGSQVLAPVQVPVSISGNALSVLEDAETSNVDDSSSAQPSVNDAPATTTGSNGLLSGTQVVAPITVPVSLSGNALSVLDEATSQTTPDSTGTSGTGLASTESNDGLLGGTQIIAPIAIPLDLSGNAISVVGPATSVTPPTSGGGNSGGILPMEPEVVLPEESTITVPGNNVPPVAVTGTSAAAVTPPSREVNLPTTGAVKTSTGSQMNGTIPSQISAAKGLADTGISALPVMLVAFGSILLGGLMVLIKK